MDYAEEAAREWFANDRARYIDEHNSAGLFALDNTERRLAELIRKYVAKHIDDINKSLMEG